MNYTIGQAAEKCGLTTHTLRFYDEKGLLPFVERNSAGVRIFHDEDFKWLETICCLKETGMKVKDIKTFMDLCYEGENALEERYEMIVAHQWELKKKIEALNSHMICLDHKAATICNAINEKNRSLVG